MRILLCNKLWIGHLVMTKMIILVSLNEALLQVMTLSLSVARVMPLAPSLWLWLHVKP